MRHLVSLCWVAILCGCLLAGCSKPPAEVSANKPLPESNAPANPIAPAEVSTQPVATDGPPAGERICFACKGSGTVKCTAPGCVDGQVDCPGPCLKLDRGVWVHLDVAGHPASDLWQKFYLNDGSYQAYNQNHVGHVIAMENGQAVDTGPCRICGGTGKVPCNVCKGTGQVVCPICEGKKYIPDSWTPTDNPWLNRQPDLIRLADGRILFGKVMSTVGGDVAIKTRDGRWLHVDTTNMASPAGPAAARPVN